MSETNNRDYQLYEESTGEKYHKGTDNESNLDDNTFSAYENGSSSSSTPSGIDIKSSPLEPYGDFPDSTLL